MRRIVSLLVLVLAVAIGSGELSAHPRGPLLPSAGPGSAVDDTTAAFDANRMRVTLTNRGWIGYPPVYSTPPDTSASPPGYEWPIGSGRSFGFAGGLWIGARVRNEIRVTVAEYTSEWAPGPLDANGLPVDPEAADPKHRVYRIDPGDDSGNSPDYAGWPIDLGAPADSSGRPLLIGDQTLWCVFNDALISRHDNPVGSSAPLGIEVRQTSWGYDRGGPLDQVMFIAYEIENKGGNLLEDAYAAMWFDADLGGAADDLVGCDTLLALGFTYNATDNDIVYAAHPPAFGCGLIQGPIVDGDTLGVYAFGRLLKNYSEPMNREDAYWRMEHGVWDTLLVPNYHECDLPGTRYEVSGDPVTGAGCRDTLAADRRFLWSTGPFDLPPGAEQRFVVALIVGGRFGQGDRLSSITDLRVRAATAQEAYFNPPQLPARPSEPLRVVPNPGAGVQVFPLRAAFPGGVVALTIHDLAGRMVWERVFHNLSPGTLRVEWDGRDQGGRKVPNALYLARLRDPEGERTVKLVRLHGPRTR